MAIALIDTNVLIDLSRGVNEAKTELLYYSDLAISNITYMEFVIGLRKLLHFGTISLPIHEKSMAIVDHLAVIDIDKYVTKAAIDIRSDSLIRGGTKIKLPDAIINATANISGRYLVTRDPRGFVGPNIRVPYQIDRNGSVVDINPSRPL